MFAEIDNKNLNLGRVISMMRLQSQDIIGLAMIRNNILKSNLIKINNSLINLQLSEPKGFVKINSD